MADKHQSKADVPKKQKSLMLKKARKPRSRYTEGEASSPLSSQRLRKQTVASERLDKNSSIRLSRLLLGTPANPQAESPVKARLNEPSRLSQAWHSFSSSAFVRGVRRTVRACAYFSARSIGCFLLFFGLTLLLLYFFGGRFFYGAHAPLSQFVIAITALVFSVPLLPGKRPLAVILSDYSAFERFFFEFLSLQHPRRSIREHENTGSLWWLLIPSLLGIACALCTAFVSSLVIAGILILLVFAGCALASPEFCLVIAALSIPFLSLTPAPTVFFAILIGFLHLSFLRKLFKGKRTIRFTLIDFFVLILAMFYMLSGIFTYRSGALSFADFGESLVTALFILAYFPAANLLGNTRVATSVTGALLFSGGVTAAIGLAEQLLGKAPAAWLDNRMLHYIDGRISSLFTDGPNVLAAYLVLLIPLCLFLFTRAKNLLARLGVLLLTSLYLAALVFTWSRGAWLGVIVGCVVFLFLLLRHRPTIFLGLAAVVPYIVLLLPSSIYHRFASIGNFYDSSIAYRLSTWRGSLRLFGDRFLSGVGIGTEAFQQAYLPYAVQGTESVAHAHNLLLEMGIELGIFPLLVFLALIVTVSVIALSRRMFREKHEMSALQISCFAAIVGLFIQGFADYVFYNSRILFLFFLIIGMFVACARRRLTDEAGQKKQEADPSYASLDVLIK